MDPAKAGLAHLIQLSKDTIARIQQELIEANKKIAAVVADYIRLAHIHDLKDLHIPGYQTFTRQHDGQTEKARFFLIAMLCTALLAVVLGTYFSTASLEGKSPMLLFLGCGLVAAVLEPICAGGLRAALGVDPEDLRSIRKAYIAIGAFWIALVASLLVFAYFRFNSKQVSDASLAIVIAAVEISAILLAAAFDCAYRYFSWSRRLDKKFHKLDQRKKDKETELADLNVKVQELEFQLAQMSAQQSATHVGSTTIP